MDAPSGLFFSSKACYGVFVCVSLSCKDMYGVLYFFFLKPNQTAVKDKYWVQWKITKVGNKTYMFAIIDHRVSKSPGHKSHYTRTSERYKLGKRLSLLMFVFIRSPVCFYYIY